MLKLTTTKIVMSDGFFILSFPHSPLAAAYADTNADATPPAVRKGGGGDNV